MLIVWIVISIALLLALLSFRGERARFEYARTRLAVRLPDSACPPASVIVPVKGMDENLKENLLALAAQDYPDFELIVTARAPGDIPEGVVPPAARVVIAGGGDPATGEKITNLIAAVESSRANSELFAFADSDGLVSPAWLRSLAAALAEPDAGLATGYRWHTPRRPDFWSNLRSVWNSVIAGGFFSANAPFCWGGAMAIRRDTFEKARVRDYWRGAISDDFQLSLAIRNSGLKIAFAPGALTADVSHTGAREFLSWITRQMMVTRVYSPNLWRMALISHVIYCASMILSAVYFPPALAAQLLLGMWKGRNRARLAELSLPLENRWIHTWWVPLGTWTWLYALVASALGQTIRWRGTSYRIGELKSSRRAP